MPSPFQFDTLNMYVKTIKLVHIKSMNSGVQEKKFHIIFIRRDIRSIATFSKPFGSPLAIDDILHDYESFSTIFLLCFHFVPTVLFFRPIDSHYIINFA